MQVSLCIVGQQLSRSFGVVEQSIHLFHVPGVDLDSHYNHHQRSERARGPLGGGSTMTLPRFAQDPSEENDHVPVEQLIIGRTETNDERVTCCAHFSIVSRVEQIEHVVMEANLFNQPVLTFPGEMRTREGYCSRRDGSDDSCTSGKFHNTMPQSLWVGMSRPRWPSHEARRRRSY